MYHRVIIMCIRPFIDAHNIVRIPAAVVNIVTEKISKSGQGQNRIVTKGGQLFFNLGNALLCKSFISIKMHYIIAAA